MIAIEKEALEKFEKEISEDIQERRFALLLIEKAIFTGKKMSKKEREVVSVHAIGMIYSIWEGFIKKSFQSYIAAINSLNIKFDLFCDTIKVFHMESTFKQFEKYPGKDKDEDNNEKEKKRTIKRKVGFYQNLKEFYSQEYSLLYHNINSKSNVNFQVMNELLNIFCLEKFPSHWAAYTHPNPNLEDLLKYFLDYRNNVAHGAELETTTELTQDYFEKYRKLVEDLMDAVRDKMLDGLTNKTFLKPYN